MTNAYSQHAKEYRFQEVMGASPIRLIIIAYEVAITSCQRHDLQRTAEALSVLRNSLNFKHGEIAGRLFAIYVWCADQARTGHWDDAITALNELREAWLQAERQMAPVTAHPAPLGSPAPVESRLVTAQA
jgi:flagellin-specific chaperone FliS